MKAAIVRVLLLAAGAPPPRPASDTAMTVSSNGELRHFTVEIFDDDRVVISRHTGIPGQPRPERRGIAGSYDRAVAVLRAKRPAVLAAAGPERPLCLDFGNDILCAAAPLPEFGVFMRVCPGPALTGLMADVLAATPVLP